MGAIFDNENDKNWTNKVVGYLVLDSLAEESLQFSCDEFMKMGDKLYWKYKQVKVALAKLQAIADNYERMSECCTDAETSFNKCITLVRERVVASSDARAFLLLISNPKMVSLLFESCSLHQFESFLSQVS